MRILKLVLISIVVLFGVVWAISLLFPSEIRVSRAITLPVSPDIIRNKIANLRNWPSWNEMLADSITRPLRFTDSTIEQPELKIVLLQAAPDTFLLKWYPKNGRVINGGLTIHPVSGEETCILQWYFDFRLKWYPWEKIGSIVFDKQLGPVMEKSLGNLKDQL